MLDAHQHFWSVNNRFSAWPTVDLKLIFRDFGPDDLWPDLQRAGIQYSVLVQAAPSYEESLYLIAIAKRTPFVRAVVGWIDFEDDSALDQLERLAASPLFKGVRPMLQSIPQPRWVLQDRFAPIFEALLAKELRFDALVHVNQISDVAELAERYPALPIILDHGGKPDIASGEFDLWAGNITRLAAHPAVHCKLSGLWTEAGGDTSEGIIRPYVRHLLASFGAERMIWGSDWPVLRLVGEYGAWLQQCKNLFADLPEPALTAIFRQNGVRFYGIAC